MGSTMRVIALELDTELVDELLTSFEDHYEIIEVALSKMAHAHDGELLNKLFRSVHTIKGNAAIMQLKPLVDFTHALEEVISSLRSGYFVVNEMLCDILMTGMDRLRDLHQRTLLNKPFENLHEDDIAQAFLALSAARDSSSAHHCMQALMQMFTAQVDYTGSRFNHIDHTLVNKSSKEIAAEIGCPNAQQIEDLELFRTLAHQVDELSLFWSGRADRLYYLASRANEYSGMKIDATQLTAAVFMHDLGMAFLTDDLVNKTTKLNAMETKRLKQHTIWGHAILVRMPGWAEAATMVQQHHEHEDGQGYPQGLQAEQIHPGAKLLAILDAFHAMTHQRADRARRRSILRAISEINACVGTQFNDYWVNVFNQIVREEVKQGNL